MPGTRSYTLSNVTLLLFWKAKQIAVHDKSLSGEVKIPAAFVLRKDDDTPFYLSLWISGTGTSKKLELSIGSTLPSDYSEQASETYAFNGTAGSLWLEGENIVIGTGDIRHVNSTVGHIDKFPLGSESDAMVLTCTGDFELKAYWRQSATPYTISSSIVVNN